MFFRWKKLRFRRTEHSLDGFRVCPAYANEDTLLFCDKEGVTLTRHDGTKLHRTETSVPFKFIAESEGQLYFTDGQSIQISRDDGKTFEQIPLGLETDESVSSVVLESDGYYIATEFGGESTSTGNPRVMKVDGRGDEIWSSVLPLGEIAFYGLVQMSVESGWRPEPKPPWKPESWRVYRRLGREGFVSSESRIFLAYFDLRSGLGRFYVFDKGTGANVWSSAPGPVNTFAAISGDRFILGFQGYGAFNSILLEKNGTVGTAWASNGETIQIGRQEILSLQLSNDSSVSQYIVELTSDGEVIKRSKRLPGYYTSKVRQVGENHIFWRAGTVWRYSPSVGLQAVDKLDLGEEAYAFSYQLSGDKVAFYVHPNYDDTRQPVWCVYDFG